jgi:4-alpha-glucanotransferase
MTDADVRDLARRAGVAMQWNDYAGKRHRVPLDAARGILAALGLPCGTAAELADSRRVLDDAATPPLITATVGEPIAVPMKSTEVPRHVRVVHEDGNAVELAARRTARGLRLPGIGVAGYHTAEIGAARITLAVAPPRCVTVDDIAPGERLWGLAAQIYGLRSAGDCGIGDMAGVTALAGAAAPLKADALALSPVHALFAADAAQFSPYSPSSRLFYNPLHADPTSVLGAERVARARAAAGVDAEATVLEDAALIDWPRSSRAKTAVFRALFDDFAASDLAAAPTTVLAAEFTAFRTARGAALHHHAVFEALHAAQFNTDGETWNWRDWPIPLRDPHSAAVKAFAQTNQRDVMFHTFLQWIADRSFAAAQEAARLSGLRIGLIADLAVGMNGGGSHAWTRQADILGGLEIGAPPDLFNADGQGWGLTMFSPRALRTGGFAAFIATLRACMRHAGGVRIDHAMGLMRLWVTPSGASPRDGAYLAYPLDDLLRLTALESLRHRAVVIGEDLGTVPAGFRERLAKAGVYGMDVLWFQRADEGFAPPRRWRTGAVAMTSTHDLPTVAGWWRGSDLELRADCGLLSDVASEQTTRDQDRARLWSAFGSGDDQPSADAAPRVVDAAVKFISEAPSQVALLPLEDALALQEQPNLPATIDQHPNWRRRYPGDAGTLLNGADVRKRLKPLTERVQR